jgi:hypothetical protein
MAVEPTTAVLTLLISRAQSCRAGTDHRSETGAVFIFRSMCIIDAIVDQSVHPLEGDISRHAWAVIQSGFWWTRKFGNVRGMV